VGDDEGEEFSSEALGGRREGGCRRPTEKKLQDHRLLKMREAVVRVRVYVSAGQLGVCETCSGVAWGGNEDEESSW